MARSISDTSRNGRGHNSGDIISAEDAAALHAYHTYHLRKEMASAEEAKAVYDAKRKDVNARFSLIKGELRIARKDMDALHRGASELRSKHLSGDVPPWSRRSIWWGDRGMNNAPDLFAITAPTQPDAVQRLPDNIERAAAVTACTRPWSGEPQHRCAAGGGDGDFSFDSGATWFCKNHRGPGFPEARAT